jgi:hypothetical protein
MERRNLEVCTVQFRASGKLWGIMLTLYYRYFWNESQVCNAVLTEYFERRQFAVLQVQFVICIQKNHLTLMENDLRRKLRTKFQIYTMYFVKVTLLLVYHVDNIHHRSLSHSVLSNHMGYPEDRTFSIPQNNFVFSNPVYKPCVIIQVLTIQYCTN